MAQAPLPGGASAPPSRGATWMGMLVFLSFVLYTSWYWSASGDGAVVAGGVRPSVVKPTAATLPPGAVTADCLPQVLNALDQRAWVDQSQLREYINAAVMSVASRVEQAVNAAAAGGTCNASALAEAAAGMTAAMTAAGLPVPVHTPPPPLCSPLPTPAPSTPPPLHPVALLKEPPFAPLLSCPRLLVVTTDAGGLGHRTWALALAIVHARRVGAGIVLDDAVWDATRVNHGGTYGFLRTLWNPYFYSASQLGIRIDGNQVMDTSHTVNTPWGTFDPIMKPSVGEALSAVAAGCNRIVTVATGKGGGCTNPATGEHVWCFDVPYAFHMAQPYLSAVFAASPYGAQVPAIVSGAPNTLIIVWHIRNDDVKLLAGKVAFFQQLAAGVQASTSLLATQHYIISQNPIPPNDPSFGFLHGMPVGFSFLSDLNVEDSFIHLAHADVIVHTGSSFSISAAAAAHASQVQVYCLPKESTSIGDAPYMTFLYAGAVPVQPDGTISPSDQVRFAALAATRLEHRSLFPRHAP